MFKCVYSRICWTFATCYSKDYRPANGKDLIWVISRKSIKLLVDICLYAIKEKARSYIIASDSTL